ncbi:UNKNOWN [Stylonychia lemnae]|uniref:Uncharacterized protein n=1 Tax=Stylonychia lemnae TaxID=5949 RepID=A0A077ZUX0_STYLE|nr:UNKNOWN [Stylonychia lemnae]|eukprot:CDW73364.1 UNKNOWN [Stylonychia lemnae]
MYFYKQTQDFHKPISKEPKFFKNRYQENYESQACEFLPTQLELVEAQKEREKFEAQITVQAPITDIKDFEYKETAYIFQESSQPKLENSQPYMTQKQLPGYRFLEKQRNEQYQLQNQQKKVSRVKLEDELLLNSDEDDGYITQQSQCLIQKVIPQIKSEFQLNFNKNSYKPQHASTSSTLTSSLQSPKFQLRPHEPILIKKQIGYPGAFNSNKFTMNRKDEKEQKFLVQTDVVRYQNKFAKQLSKYLEKYN